MIAPSAISFRRLLFLFQLLFVFPLSACSSVQAGVYGHDSALRKDNVIFIVSNGWHSGIIIARSDMPADHIAEMGDFPEARYLEFGWGDRAYYPAKDPTLGMGLRALFTPTPSVMHMAGLRVAPSQFHINAEIVALGIDDSNLIQLVSYIDASFDRTDETRARPIGPGLYAQSLFYPAKGKFYLGNTCNTWTARGLGAAGFEIRDSGISGADELMYRVRGLVPKRNLEHEGE